MRTIEKAKHRWHHQRLSGFFFSDDGAVAAAAAASAMVHGIAVRYAMEHRCALLPHALPFPSPFPMTSNVKAVGVESVIPGPIQLRSGGHPSPP